MNNKIVKRFFFVLALMVSTTLSGHAAEHPLNTVVKHNSAYDYQQTRARLLDAININNLVLFGEFDHAKAAQDRQLTMPPTTVLVFGNPKGGTPLMLAHPDLALDLPFRVLISQQPDGRVQVSYHPAETLLSYGLDPSSIQALQTLEQLVQKSIQ